MKNELQFAQEIKRALDRGLGLDPEVGQRLRIARERALELHRAPAGAVVVGGTGGSAVLRSAGGPHGSESLSRTVAPVLFLVAALFGIHQWQEWHESARIAAQETEEIVDVDTRVLTSDLPFNALIDEDFQQWLAQPSE